MSDKTYYQQDWLTIPLFKEWLSAGKQSTKGYCKRCSKTFELSNMGIQAVKSHAADNLIYFVYYIPFIL